MCIYLIYNNTNYDILQMGLVRDNTDFWVQC